MEVWTIIGIIMLVSIITGTTMHNAFWGIVSFSCSVTVLLIVLAIFRAIFSSVKESITTSSRERSEKSKIQKQQIASLSIQQQRILAEQKKKRRKEALKDDLFATVVFISIMSPLLIGVVLALACGDFTVNHPGWTFLIAASPFFSGLVYLFAVGTKGQSPLQRLKSFGRFSWGITKMFLIVLAVMVGLGLIFAFLHYLNLF